MVAIHAISGRTLALGREGENLARQVVFDISAWREAYGQGTVSLIAKRHGDAEPYPCNITVDGDTVTWPITSADTACPDYGHCELRYSVGDVLVKSEMWRTFVADALGTPQPEPPEPQKAWVDKVLAAGQAAKDASVNPPKIGENGNWFVWDFDAGMYVDTGVAASGGGGSAVSSVNGKTGEVELTAGDVGAATVNDVNQLKSDLAKLSENEKVILDYTLTEDSGDIVSIQLDSNFLDGLKTLLFWFDEMHDTTENTGWKHWKLTNKRTNTYNKSLLLSYGSNPKCVNGILRCYGFSVFFNNQTFSAFRKGVQNTPQNDGAVSLNAVYGDFPQYLDGTLALEYNGTLKSGTRLILVGRY